jgi:hypothetical protein
VVQGEFGEWSNFEMNDLTAENNQETNFCQNGTLGLSDGRSNQSSNHSRRRGMRCLPGSRVEIPLFSFTMLVIILTTVLMLFVIIKASTLSF